MTSGLPDTTLVDSHAHLDSPELLDQLDGLIDEARAAAVSRILTIGCVSTDAETLNRPLEIAERHPGIAAALGVHPHDARFYSDELGARILAAMSHPKVLAWGEIGLDYHYQHSDSESQISTFRSQLELSLEAGKPVIIHSRAAADQTCEILEDYRASGLRGVMHCFTYDQETADRCLNFGFFLSFGGFSPSPKPRNSARSLQRPLPIDIWSRRIPRTWRRFPFEARPTGLPMSSRSLKSWPKCAVRTSRPWPERPPGTSNPCLGLRSWLLAKS